MSWAFFGCGMLPVCFVFLTAMPILSQSAYDNLLASQKPSRISEDVNIKGRDPKMLNFDIVLPSSTLPSTKILYDRAVEGDMCFISCNFYNGVTSKWSNFYLYLQPFENFCLTLAGCSGQYPAPSQDIAVIVDGKRNVIAMTDPDSNGYYMPLELRQQLAATTSQVSIEISGIKMPLYKIGVKNSRLIAGLVDTSQELLVRGTEKQSKEERLRELQELHRKGLITDRELNDSRLKILSE